MRPLLHPTLLNGRFGDPALYVETLFEKHAVLFDLSALPPRKIQRIEHVFVSHAHIDHFIGFDRLLRVLAGREKQVNLYGPPEWLERVDEAVSMALEPEARMTDSAPDKTIRHLDDNEAQAGP